MTYLKGEGKGKNQENLVLPLDYQRIFDRRIVIITGVSRAGTSILGKIIGSLENVIYLFEPVIVRLLPILAHSRFTDFEIASQLLRGLLFEDYYLQMLHGRCINYKKSDNSYVGNYQSLKTVKERWVRYGRRSDLIRDIYRGKFVFALKISETQPFLPIFEKVFKEPKIIHIIRNGNEVISSSVKRGWYSDEHLNNLMVQWMRKGRINIPWFVPDRDAGKFCDWNAETRIAYAWRILTKIGRDYGKGKKNYFEIRYEDLVKDPEKATRACGRLLGLRKTRTTLKNIGALKRHIPTEHPDQTAKIHKDERSLFQCYMKELRYL